eukprot:gene25725-11383_t
MAAVGQTPFTFGTPTQAAQSPGLFGAATTPAATGAFGAPAPAQSPFGFGAGFGTPAAQTPSAFGANTTPAFGANSAWNLGKTTPAPAAAATGSPGLFGATTTNFGQAQPAANLFGGGTFGFNAPSTSATGSAFSFSPATTQPQTTASLFGAAPAAGALAPAGQPNSFSGTGLQPDAAIKEISETRNAYTPNAPSYKFHHLFLSVVDDPAQRVKPPQVDEMRWRQALAQAGGPNNPDRLWPVLACGPKDLLLRSATQQRAIEENQARLKTLADLAQKLSAKNSGDLRQRSADVQKRHVELSHRLLQATRNLDALEGRLAAGIGSVRGDQASGAGLPRRLRAVGASVQLRSGGMAKAENGATKLDENSVNQLFSVLKEHAEGIKHLQHVLKANSMDVAIMQQHMR